MQQKGEKIDLKQQVRQNQTQKQIAKKMTFKMCFLKATNIWAMNTAAKDVMTFLWKIKLKDINKWRYY